MTENFEEDPDFWVRKVAYTVRRPDKGWPESFWRCVIANNEWYFAAEQLRGFYRARGA